MTRAVRYLGRLVVLAVFGLVVAAFADWPSYRHIDEDRAVIRLSLVHSAKREGKCHRRTAEELAALPPNMRNPLDCPRGRLPVTVELEIDGKTVFADTASPAGLAGDGPSRLQARFEVAAGRHRLAVRMRDSDRSAGFDYTLERELELAPRRNLVVDFKAEAGGLVLR